MFKYSLLFCLVIFGLNEEAESQSACFLNIGANSGTAPLIIDDYRSYPGPISSGEVMIGWGSGYTMACPGGRLYPLGLNSEGQGVVCRGGGGFSIKGLMMSFYNVSCTTEEPARPAFVERYPNIRCENSVEAVEVGYNIAGDFIPVYSICWQRNGIPLYSKYNITQYARLGQNYRSPPQYSFFIYLYEIVDPLSAYSNVTNRFEELGLQGYLDDVNFLTKGHMADYEDFFYQYHRDATYNLANVAPQWNTFDQGNWKILENAVVSLVEGGNTGDATVLTGTLNIATLTNSNGDSVEIYLSEGRFPVPRWFWKLVYFTESNFGAIFFGYNNPFHQKFDIDAEFFTEICYTDVFPTLKSSWLLDDVVPDDPSLGYMYACPLHTVQIIDLVIFEIILNVMSDPASKIPYTFPETKQTD